MLAATFENPNVANDSVMDAELIKGLIEKAYKQGGGGGGGGGGGARIVMGC